MKIPHFHINQVAVAPFQAFRFRKFLYLKLHSYERTKCSKFEKVIKKPKVKKRNKDMNFGIVLLCCY